MDNNDESSSDSSIDDHFESPDKINFNTSFFNTPNPKKSSNTVNKSSNSSKNDEQSNSDDSDDDFISEDNVSSTALLAEVMKNLEQINNATIPLNVSQQTPSTSYQLTPKNKTPTKKETKSYLLSNEINDLLLKGETDLGTSNFQLSNDNENEDDDNEVISNKQSDYSIPKEGVNITLPGTELLFNRRKKRGGVDLIDELRKKMNRRLRTNQMYIHKVGLLCWLAHGFHLNKQTNDPEVMSIVLSLIPQKSYPKGRVDLKYLEQFTKWFKSLIKIELDKRYRNIGRKVIGECFTVAVTKDSLINGLTNKKVDNYRELVLLYIAALRAIGINCRLVISLCPPYLKPKHDDLFHNQKQHASKEENSDDDDDDKDTKTKKENEKKKRKKPAVKIDNKLKKKIKVDEHNIDNENESDDEVKPSKVIPKNSKKAAAIAAEDAKKRAAELIRLKYMKTCDVKKKFDHNVSVKESNDDNHDEEKVKSPVQIRQLRSRTISKSETKTNLKEKLGNLSKIVKDKVKDDDYKEDDGDDDDEEEETESVVKKPILKGRRKNVKAEEVQKKISNISKPKQESIIDRRVLSPVEFENQTDNIEDNGYYYYIWVEVYVESEENWICVSVPDDKIHCVNEIYKKLPTPVLYIIAFNSLGKLKDVTRRYCSNWLTVTRKQRIDEKWWSETLSPWKEAETAISKAEDESLEQSEMEQPLPKSISECKGHPLYALVRHLLKFEALYPPDCVPLGHLKNGEAIYSRHCVHTLRSRETWLKQARVVKPAQEPYKIVKAMPKYDKLSGQLIKDQPLELFGHWQTMAYVPPEAKNGKVPRNEYGNVDLFQDCMLPKGTVHIDLPGLFRVAKKLNIDCVAAVVGFNFGGRGAMPMTQGYVVCEEYEDILREAWEEEQIKAAARAKEKRDKRIWGNWRKLIRGLFIREKIIAKYDMNEDNEGDDKNEDDDDNKKTKRPKKHVSKVVKKKKM